MTNKIVFDMNNTINNMIIDCYSVWEAFKYLHDGITVEELRKKIEKISAMKEALGIKTPIVVGNMIYIKYDNDNMIECTINNKRMTWQRIVYKNYLIHDDGSFLYKSGTSGDEFKECILSEFFPKNIFKWTDEHHTMFKLSNY